MPIEVGIWRINDEPQKVSFSRLESEEKLEDILAKDISLLSPDLMLIGRQVPTAHGTFIDLLGMDAEGNLSVIELKRHKTPREVVAQALDYASWVQGLSYAEIADIYTDRNGGEEFEQGFAQVFDTNPPDKVNESLKIVIVAAELDNASERIINYLADNFGVPINAVFFRYFKDSSNEYLTRTWLIDPQDAEAKTSKITSSKGREPWNGHDYYVSYGESDDSDLVWEDGRQYGFIAADGGTWYTRTMSALKPGARIFVCVPGCGYVGVGTVTDSVKTPTEFSVLVNDVPTPIYEAPLKGDYMMHHAGDTEKQARFVAVEWTKTLPVEQAIWEKGMYANQNTVTKLRNRFTLERLTQTFGLEE